MRFNPEVGGVGKQGIRSGSALLLVRVACAFERAYDLGPLFVHKFKPPKSMLKNLIKQTLKVYFDQILYDKIARQFVAYIPGYAIGLGFTGSVVAGLYPCGQKNVVNRDNLKL